MSTEQKSEPPSEMVSADSPSPAPTVAAVQITAVEPSAMSDTEPHSTATSGEAIALAVAGTVDPVVATPPAPAPAEIAGPSVGFLRPGEVLEFRMSWGILSNIGQTRIETLEEEVEGLRHFRIRITTTSRGVLDAIYPVANDSESVIDMATGRPLAISIEGKSGNRPTKTMTLFDYVAEQVVHTDYIRPERSGTAKLPPEPAYDLMVAMLQARDWRMKPGEKRNVLTAFEDDFYFITLTAHRRERVRTPVGTFDAVMIEPTQIGEQKGFFRRGGSMKVWISDGPHPQIVKMVFKTKAGTITAVLSRATGGGQSIASSD